MGSEKPRHRFNVPGARKLRERQTAAEVVLWEALRNRRLDGLKFRRQHPIGPFVADFCCPDRRLLIELDGDVHATQREHDGEREALLHAAGYRIVRFPNEMVFADLASVLARILEAAAEIDAISPAERQPRTGAW